MPVTQQSTKVVNARRFAALLAGFDTGNACDEEALSKGRALRRMAAESHLRIVDLLEVPEIRQAIDDQMQPVRKDRQDLRHALEEAAVLREELTERTRNVRALAEMLTREKEATAELRQELAALTFPVSHSQVRNTHPIGATSPSRLFIDVSHSLGAQSWVFEIALVLAALVLICSSAFN